MEKLKPMLWSVMKGYTKEQLVKDIVAGIIVAIIALPLSIALALASGVTPERGIYTAITAGFVISFLGGSRVQIAGPTAAFATIVAGIAAENGIEGLALATVMAGIILIIILILIFKFIYRPDDINTINPEKAMSLRGTVPEADAKEKIILAVMFLTVFLWVFPSLVKGVLPKFYETVNGWSTAMPPLLGCIILFIVHVDGERIMNFKETASKGVLWGSILMTAAATQLGACLTNQDVGISSWLTGALQPLTAHMPVIGMILFFMTWAVIETNFSSNIVTTTVVSAVALSVLSALPSGSVNIAAVVSMVGFAAAISNMTPAGQSTVNTVAIGSGWTDTKSMFIWGGLFAIAGIIVLSFIAYPLGSLVM